MDGAYLLWHAVEPDDPNEDEIVRIVGAYRTEADARAAIARAKAQPEFAAHPDGFMYDFYAFGEEGWADGFEIV